MGINSIGEFEELLEYYPMKLHPCYKEALWGGRKLKTEYRKEDAPTVCAESWELSCHPDGQCVVSNGVYAGKKLADVIASQNGCFQGESIKMMTFLLW